MRAGKGLFAGLAMTISRLQWSVSEWLAGLVTVLLLAALWRNSEFNIVAFAIAGAFALAAWLMKGVTAGGAVAGGMVALVFFSAKGWRLFALLLFVFVLTLAATKLASRKRARPLQPRGADQVMANLFVAAIALVADPPFPAFAFTWWVVVTAALAELAADTVSSEMGEAFGKGTFSVILKGRVSAGANGGLSLVGTAAGLIAVISVVVVANLLFAGVPLQSSVTVAIAGFLGMLIDSVLGATLENKGWLNNNAVNLLSTASAALIAYLLFDWTTVRI